MCGRLESEQLREVEVGLPTSDEAWRRGVGRRLGS